MDENDADEIFARRGEHDESMEFRAPWNWHDLPIIRGDPKFDRILSGDTLVVEQLTGRKLRLGAWHQFPTHSGMASGMPQVRDHFIEQALKTARSIFGEYRKRIVILTPNLVALPHDKLLWPEFPAARLPLVTSIAEFHSTPVRGNSACGSSALVIWFEDHFGSPTLHTLGQIRDLDWEGHSWNSDP